MAALSMKNMKVTSLRLRGKIVLLYVVSIALLLIAAAAGFWQFNATLHAFEQVNVAQGNAVAVEGAVSDFKKQVQEWKDTLLRGKNPDALAKHWKSFQDRESDVQREAGQLGRAIPDPEIAKLVTQFVEAHRAMGEAYRRGLQAFKDHQFDSAAGDQAVAGIDRAPTELLTKARDSLVARALSRATEAEATAHRAILISGVLFLVMTAVGVAAFLFVIQKNVSNPLARLTGVMQQLAGGQNDVDVFGSDRGDDIGDIARTVLVFRDNALEKARLEADQKAASANFEGQLTAINRVQAVIEFSLDGKILTANDNFLKTLGYRIEEVRGQHHSMFAEPSYAASPEYQRFWQKLARGEYDAGQYKRLGKGGKEIWIQASYNPILDQDGKPYKVVKYATDITSDKLRNADYEGQISAIGKAQAVIEFSMDGKILNANDNFLKTLGYTLEEVKGQHHSMFAEPAYKASPEYKLFWEKLGRGEYDAGQYKRLGNGGKEIWIQASYNPILDANGKPFKVVKYATDITAQVHAQQALQLAVQQTQDVVKAAEGNDLTKRIPMSGKEGEIAALCSGVNGLIDTMASVVRKIKGAAREVTNASAEISTSTTDLSQRTEEQAASLEETSASMEEISATVKKNAENAQQANQSATGTREVADRGGQVVAKAVDAMARIEESSGKISDIIGVIDEIARQTNLLALNAAVEAARAGDAGRGFAVVASEVRSLAQRSSQAAKDIKDLITNSNGQVKDGVELVNRAGSALTEIVESIKKVADIVSDIATASMEQSTGIEQVNKALTQMDEVTQQNSALVEENAATAKTLEQQAAAMSAEVNQFRIGDDEVEVPAAPAAEKRAPVVAVSKQSGAGHAAGAAAA